MTEQGKVLDINGLTTEEVKERQEKYGKNQFILTVFLSMGAWRLVLSF